MYSRRSLSVFKYSNIPHQSSLLCKALVKSHDYFFRNLVTKNASITGINTIQSTNQSGGATKLNQDLTCELQILHLAQTNTSFVIYWGFFTSVILVLTLLSTKACPCDDGNNILDIREVTSWKNSCSSCRWESTPARLQITFEKTTPLFWENRSTQTVMYLG